MSKICPSCGAEAPDQFRYCGFCAAPLDAAPRESAAAEPAPAEAGSRSSRRLVTMLFADLTNYTHAAARVDPEEMFVAIRRTLEQLAQPVTRLGGRIDRYVGDGFLATFGIPEAHEDDPVRAVLTALELQRAMYALRREAQQSLGWDVQLRLGLNVGPVISGQLETGALPDASVFGHAVNVAHRLQEAARPGTILVSEPVYRLTRNHFEYRDPINLHLKGLDGPIVSYEVVGPRAAPLPSRGLSGRPTPLIGRAAENAALLAALQRLKVERQGLIAIIGGEPGIGKTRLVDEVLAPLSNHFTIVRAAGSPTEGAGYGLLTDLIEHLAGIAPDDSSAVRQQRVEDWLAPSSTLARDIGPVLYNLVSRQTSREGLIGNPQQDQRRIYAAMRRLVAWLARRRALLLVIDDLQWADPSSLAVLAHVADLVNEAPLGIIGLARRALLEQLPEPFVQAETAEADKQRSYLRLELGPLTPAESDELLSLLLNDVQAPPDLIPRLAERTNGNPLLIEEMVRMLLDQNIVREGEQGWEVMPQWVETIRQVPETVNGLILSRYDRLAPPLKKTLDAAAVLGYTFSLPLLIALTGQPEPDLRRQLTHLEQVDFLRRAPGPGLPVYSFRHWLMQEAIYETILQKERRALHLRAAQVIQQMAEALSVDMSARVGYHLEHGQSRQAIGYLMQAARSAADRFANEEAIAYYERIQALLDQHGARQEEAVDVALGLTELLARTNQHEAARDALEKARSLSLSPPRAGYRLSDVLYQFGLLKGRQGQGADARSAFEAAAANLREHGSDQGQVVTFSDIEREIGWLLLDQGQLAEARVQAEKALHLALQQNDLQAAASAHTLLAGSHYYAGQLSESVSSALRALAIREQLGDVWGSAAAQSNLAGLYYKLGQWAQAEAFVRQAIFVQQEIGDYRSLGASWNVLGLLLHDSGRYEEALHSLNQSLAVMRGQDQVSAAALRYLARGHVWLRLGVATWATADLERSLSAATQVKNDDVRAVAMALLAEARLVDSDLDHARGFLLQADTLAQDSGSLDTRAEVLRVRAVLRQAERDWDRALEANQQARELFRQIGNRYEVARRQVEAAELMLARSGAGGRPPNGDVTTGLREALETFHHLRAQADIPRAENLLARLTSGLAPGRLGEQMVAVVHVRLALPDLAGESEARQEELAGLFGRMSATLEKVGSERGALVATSGAGLVYLFNSPNVELTESLAQQAVQGALDAIDAAARVNRSSRRQNSLEIPVSLGLSAGRWPTASTDPQEAAIFASASQPGQHAAAAAVVAGANQIALTGDITQVLRNIYDLELIEGQAVEAPEQHVGSPFLRLGRVRSQTQLPQPLPSSSSQLIGRQAELGALLGWVDRLRSEQRGLVCYVEAEAGMGKTRLLDQVLAYARTSVLCLVGKCESFRAGMSYWPLLSILEQPDLPETPTVQQLQGLLGLRPPEEADNRLLRNLPPAHLRQEIFARVRLMLLQAAAQRPVLLMVEDIHWLDLSSLDLIDYLLPVTQEAPLALMLVARAEMPGPHRSLVHKAEQLFQGRYLPVSFDGLTADETRSLVESLLKTGSPPDGVWPLLAPFTGHPLSVEEALRFLVESGWLWEAGGRWHLAYTHSPGAPAGATGERRMPPTFKDLLLRRLDLLPNETLHVLQAAAVLGESFDHTVLSHVIGGPAVARRLTELVERGWLLPASPDNPLVFRFKHTLTRETIYATLLTAKLRVLHQRAGEALESLYPEAQAENVEVLAYHFGHSSLRDKALSYLTRAAQAATARFALAEGLAYYQQARELAAQLAEPQPRLTAAIALGLADVHLAQGDPTAAIADVTVLTPMAAELPPELRAGCWRRLGAARRSLGQFAAALESYQTAREALVPAAEPQLAAAGAGGPASEPEPGPAMPSGEALEREARTIDLGLAQTLFDMRENQRARAQAEHTLRSLDRRRFPELAGETLRLLGGIAYRQGEIDTSVQLVRDSLAIFSAYGNRSGAAAAYGNLGVLAANRQDNDAALNNLNLALTLHEALGNSQGIAATRNNLGQLERNRGRFGEAIEHLGVAAEKARHAGLNPLLAQALANLGHALTLAGQRDEALPVFDEAGAVCQGYGLRDTLCETQWKRAECLLESGDLPGAERSAQAALALADEINSGDLRSEARRVLSRLERHRGQAEAALQHASAAWQARSGSNNRAVRARFAAEYALALIAAGRAAEAQHLLEGDVNPVQMPESEMMLREIAAALGSM